MFNCIESDALMDMCKALGLTLGYPLGTSDVYIVYTGSAESIESGGIVVGYRLSDYLLATAPVDVKED